jgi:hypothetical protein
MKYLLILILLGCGYVDIGDDHGHEIVIEGETPIEITFTDEKIRKDCFSAACHNDSAPDIPTLGDGFKSSAKVKARVSSGTMPPGGYNANEIRDFLDYIDAD